MVSQSVVILLGLLSISYGLENLKLAFQWKMVDFDYPTSEAREDAIKNGKFVPENNLPLGLDVHGDRLFITVPRWKSGVAASLTYINLNDPVDSPILHPYPNWEAHKIPDSKDGKPPEIVSPFRVRADRCDRLWVLDTGIAESEETPIVYSLPQVLIYDLLTDTLIRRFQIPNNQVSGDSSIVNLVVEDEDCENSYGYFSDLGDSALIVYSYLKNSSWRIKHNYFEPNPSFSKFNVGGLAFEWLGGVFGMGISAPGPDGYSTLYFHCMTGINEFAVSTRYLRNASLAERNSKKFRIVGNRGTNGQSNVGFLDKKTGVLFYSLVNHNAIACWKTTNPTQTIENQARIHENNITMIFPNDIKVDANDNIWVLSDRLPVFFYSKLNVSDVNYRIFTAPVAEAIKGTVCDSNFKGSGLSDPPLPPCAISPDDPSGIFFECDLPTKNPIRNHKPPRAPHHRPHFHDNSDSDFVFKPHHRPHNQPHYF